MTRGSYDDRHVRPRAREHRNSALCPRNSDAGSPLAHSQPMVGATSRMGSAHSEPVRAILLAICVAMLGCGELADYRVPPASPINERTERSPTLTERGVSRIHIETSEPDVTLRATSDGMLTDICRAPCDTIVDGRGGREFFFDGPGVTPSNRFSLAQETGDVAIKVHAGNGRLASAGGTMLVTGLLLVVVVAPPLMFAADAAADGNHVPGLAYLATLTGLGVASTVVGGILMNAHRTTYQFQYR